MATTAIFGDRPYELIRQGAEAVRNIIKHYLLILISSTIINNYIYIQKVYSFP